MVGQSRYFVRLFTTLRDPSKHFLQHEKRYTTSHTLPRHPFCLNTIERNIFSAFFE